MTNPVGPQGPGIVPKGRGPVQVLVLWADDSSPNLGVRALGRGTEALVRGVWPDAETTFINYGHGTPQLPLGRLRSVLREQVTGRLGMQQWISRFDLVLDTRSGDSFTDIYGLRRHVMMTALAACVKRAGVPLVLGPQTIGPFNSLAGRVLARKSLSAATAVMARDPASAANARRLGRPADVLTTDVVFALPLPPAGNPRDVMLNISGLLWNPNPHLDHNAYRTTVQQIHNGLLAQGRNITVLAHVLDSGNADNDAPAIREFMHTTGSKAEVLMPNDLDEARLALASCNVVLSSRMHACLNALSVGTPAVPLAYSRKFAPLFDGLGWPHTVELRRATPDPADAALGIVARAGLSGEVAGVVTKAHQAIRLAELCLRNLP